MSDNTTSISDNRNDNSNDRCVASGNTNRIFVIGCKNVNSVSSGNTPSSNGNNSYIIINIASSVVPDYNVPTIVNDTVDMNNVNDNIGNLDNGDDSTIRWDDVAAMEDAARDFEEVSFPVPPVGPGMARTAPRSPVFRNCVSLVDFLGPLGNISLNHGFVYCHTQCQWLRDQSKYGGGGGGRRATT